MSFAEVVARQQKAVFDRLGEDAAWSGVAGTVRVRLREEDDSARLGEGTILMGVMHLRVRRSDVPEPSVGESVILIASGRAFKVSSDPSLNRRGVWMCPVVEMPA